MIQRDFHQRSMTIAASPCDLQPTKVSFQDTLYQLVPGQALIFDLSDKGVQMAPIEDNPHRVRQ